MAGRGARGHAAMVVGARWVRHVGLGDAGGLAIDGHGGQSSWGGAHRDLVAHHSPL